MGIPLLHRYRFDGSKRVEEGLFRDFVRSQCQGTGARQIRGGLCDELFANHLTYPLRSLSHSTMRFQLFSLLSFPLLLLALQEPQIPMGNPLTEDTTHFTTTQPTLADLMTIEPSASIFYSYARELELSAIFADTRASSTLFVPTNKAVMALARKP